MDFTQKKDVILKKAHKLSLLCDAEVSVIIISGDNEKVYEYTCPTSTMKKIIDEYQSRVGVDLWSSHYEKMKEELRRLEDINTNIRREIMQRNGEELDNLNMQKLCSLQEEMLDTLEIIQTQKFRVIRNQIDTCKKKLKRSAELQEHLKYDLEMKGGGIVLNDRGNETAAFSGRVYYNPALVQQRARLQRDDDEGSCLTTFAVDVEDSD